MSTAPTPREARLEESRRSTSARSDSSPKAPERLLILDDEPAVGRMLELLARHAGHDACLTSESSEFFQAVDAWRPTLIALDLVMPGMDGVEVLLHLAERGCRSRIILTSGVGNRVLDAAQRSAAEHGLHVVGVLPKPFSPKAFKEMLAAAASDPDAGGLFTVDSTEPVAPVGPADLRDALAAQELRNHYQPKVRCATGALAGFEALARWTHRRVGPVEPTTFIPMAEDSGLMERLTSQMLDVSLEWFAGSFGGEPAAAAEGRPPAPSLAVNLSPRMLRDRGLVERILEQHQRWGVDPSRTILEITETTAMEDPFVSLALLTRLRMKGFQLSIDDFGTGYSSMQQLVRLPFSELKIDRSFVLTALRSAESRKVVRSIVDLGHSLGLCVTAEGVEDEETMRFVVDTGCDLAQGFFIGRPMPGAEVPGWIASRAP